MADACRGRGLDHADYCEFAKALDDLNKAVGPDDCHAESLQARGSVYLKTGNWQGAIDDFSQAITREPSLGLRLRPKLAEAYFGRGLKKQQEGRFAEAGADFDRAKKHGW